MKALKKYAPWLFLGMVVLLTLYMDVYVARTLLDGDASDFMVHARTIAQEGNPFARDRYFTTELRLMDLSAVFALFFRFTENWTLVRILGTVTMQAWYVLGFLYLCRRGHVAWPHAALAAGLLLMPFSTPYARIVIYHLHYILYLANAFWMMGLTLRVLHTRGKKAVLPGVLLMAMWVFVGLNGVRHMMILGAPMLLVALAALLRKLCRYRWEDGRLCGEAPLLSSDEARLTAIVLVSSACWLIGFVINIKVLLPYYGAVDMASMTYRPTITADEYVQRLNGWLSATGVRHSELSLMGVRGLSLLAALFGFGYLTAVSLQSLKSDEPLGQRLMHGLLGASLITTTFLLVFDQSWRHYELYYVPVVAMAIPALAQEMGRWRDRAASACRKLLIVLCCLCLLFQGLYTVYFLRVDRDEMDDWTGITHPLMDTAQFARQYAGFMLENGYTHGLINYWYASVMTEVSDGRLTMAPLLDDRVHPEQITMEQWGTSRTAFAAENLPEKVIVFIHSATKEMFENANPSAVLVYEDSSVCGYEISSDDIQ